MNSHLDDARLDLQRTDRIDMPEAIYCEGKTVEQCVSIVERMLKGGTDAVIATRATSDQQAALQNLSPRFDTGTGSTFVWRPRPSTQRRATVVAAGTSDLDVAAECQLTLAAMGHQTDLVVDVGVAGLHRLLNTLDRITQGEVIVAVAGMEGALATVLAGLIALPIIAVPTSVGYGTAFGGQTALNSMLTSCAPGVSVVGIDNGYGAACAAHRILRSAA